MILSEEDHKVLNQFSGLDKKANSEKFMSLVSSPPLRRKAKSIFQKVDNYAQ